MRLSLVTAPTVRCVSLTEAKDSLRLETTDDDALVSDLIDAVVEIVQRSRLQRQLNSATWKVQLDDFPTSSAAVIRLPLPPLQSVSSITYVDADGATQTWASSNYTVHAFSGPHAQKGFVELAYDASWPTTRDVKNAVAITFVAGYGDNPADVPRPIRDYILRQVASLYEHRETFINSAAINSFSQLGFIEGLLDPYTIKEAF